MAKSFKLKANPTFKATVNIPLVGEDPMKVGFTFRTFNRIQLAELFEKWKEQQVALLKEAEDAAEVGNELTMVEWAKKEIVMQREQVKDIAVGWGFSDEFNDENIDELVGMSVSITDVIIEHYNEAYARARKGN